MTVRLGSGELMLKEGLFLSFYDFLGFIFSSNLHQIQTFCSPVYVMKPVCVNVNDAFLVFISILVSCSVTLDSVELMSLSME